MTSPARVVVLDDYFPRLTTGFRIAEFTWMLDHGVIDAVYTSVADAEEVIRAFGAEYPDHAAAVHPYSPDALDGVALASIVFLNNALHYLDDLESRGVPFIVTLYPGGGLNLGSPATDAHLRRVLGSPLLRAIITTTPVVTRYLREHCDVRVPLREIPGAVVGRPYFQPGAGLRENYFPEGKPTLDLGFAAHRYTHDGGDKGFPVFVEVVTELLRRNIPVHGHIVGGFSRDDLHPEHPLAASFTFHGTVTGAPFRALLSELDFIVSPNRPGRIAEFAFDGFPTTSAIEAALCGAVMVVSDELRQNSLFLPGHDIVIAPPDPVSMADQIMTILSLPGGTRRRARVGVSAVRRHYSPSAQLVPRREVIDEAMATVRRPAS